MALLRSWWSAEGLPPLARLSERQLGLVLARIDELCWDTRPL